MADGTDFSRHLRRSAESLVQALGASTVQMQLPAPPVAGDDGEELGLRSPLFQTKDLTPVAVRRSASAMEIVIAASVLEDVLGVHGEGAVIAALAGANAVLVDGVAHPLKETEAVGRSGDAFLYRFVLLPDGLEVL